ncbi:MAG: TlpA family protein disulfide reductase [Acidimicrobiia bacterium]|jgi:cytochrome c biogenesis protein CcmG/thiol:disulfide interchange protein DsbE
MTAPARERRRIGPWIAGAVLVVLAAFIGVLATGGDDGGVRSTLIGRTAPGIAGDTIDGATYDLAQHRGEFVVVNFFATWCVPCIREHPELVDFEERHRETGDASVVSVVFDSRPQQVREFFAEYGGEWPVVLDPDGRTALEYGVTGVPESYVLAPDGTVLLKIEGGVTAAALEDLLEQVQVGSVDAGVLGGEDEAEAE